MTAGNAPVRVLGVLATILATSCGAGAALAPRAGARPRTLQISTQPALYPPFDTTISDYTTRCSPGTPIQVTVSAPSGAVVSVDGQAPHTGSFTAQVGLNAGQSFPVTATTSASSNTYFVRCLPSDFPGWTSSRTGQPQAEYFTVAPFARTDFQPIPAGVSGKYLAIFDTNGVPMWWMKSVRQPLDFHLLSNGDVVWTQFGEFSGSQEHSLDGTLVRTIQAVPPGVATDEHEILLLPNGDYALIAERPLSGFDVCGKTNVTITDLGTEEVTPQGSLVWSWFASDHIPMSEVPDAWCRSILASPAPNGELDVYHQNAIEPDGNAFVISFRHLDAVYKISKTDGSIVWKLGGVSRPESLTVLGDSNPQNDTFRGQHDPRVLSDGTLTVHDNGFHPGSQRTARAVRFAIEPAARIATLVEQINDPGTLQPAICCGSARKLPGGDWVMSWGTNDLVTELSPAGARVFGLTFANNLFSYRSWPVLPGTVSRAALRAGMEAQYPRGYPRPRGATPLRVALVPAYNACTAPNEGHGAPLSSGSCSPPTQTSSFLTIGTLDANGAPANSVGSVLYTVHLGNPSTPNGADVLVAASLTDVRRRSDLSDYTGQVQVHSSVRITDRLNGPAQDEAGTTQDLDLPVTSPCAATADTTVGATCSISSSFNAIVPGAIVDGKRAIWQLGQVQVYDGGARGVAGASDARLFEDEGIFAP